MGSRLRPRRINFWKRLIRGYSFLREHTVVGGELLVAAGDSVEGCSGQIEKRAETVLIHDAQCRIANEDIETRVHGPEEPGDAAAFGHDLDGAEGSKHLAQGVGKKSPAFL